MRLRYFGKPYKGGLLSQYLSQFHLPAFSVTDGKGRYQTGFIVEQVVTSTSARNSGLPYPYPKRQGCLLDHSRCACFFSCAFTSTLNVLPSLINFMIFPLVVVLSPSSLINIESLSKNSLFSEL